jgi:hypothetical protein
MAAEFADLLSTKLQATELDDLAIDEDMIWRIQQLRNP